MTASDERRAPLRADLALLLMELESWEQLLLGTDFRCLGPQTGGEVLRAAAGDDVREGFDPAAVRSLEEMAASLARKDFAGGTIQDAAGRPLEILLVAAAGGYRMFVRSLEARINTLERLMFHYRFFQRSPQPIFCTDPDGKILDANRAFLDLYGLTLPEVQGNTPRVIKSSRQVPEAYAAIWRQIKDPSIGSWTGEVTNRKKDGSEIVVLASITAVRRTDGGLLGFVATHQDITQRKALERELLIKNRDLERLSELKSEFVAITSHDLKSPLSVIVNYAELLRDAPPGLPKEKLNAYLENILEGAESMARFVDGILDLRQIETGTFQLEPSRVKLEKLLGDLARRLAVLASQKQVELTFSPGQGCPRPVIADPARLEQVFANLIGNAIKFAPPGTPVEITLDDAEDGAARLLIRDHGPGIPPVELSKIFSSFYQVRGTQPASRRARGHGLGLSIARQIVEQHQGRISAGNADDGGAVFTVEIPRRQPRRGEEIGAVLYDPRQQLATSLLEPLRRRGSAVFVATSPQELSRLLCFEHPELLLLEPAACGPEALELCRDYQSKNARAIFVGIGEAAPAGSLGDVGLFQVVLTEPVSDLEVFEVLDLVVRADGLP